MTNQELNTHAIKVIGHRNPDTDSICSAIAYSRLKNKLDPEHPCKPCRAGLLNRETEFVLNRFQTPVPELYTDVSPQLRDVDIRPIPGVDGEMTVRRAWSNMRDLVIDTLCVVDEGRSLKGLITVRDIATANMEVPDISILAESRTSYHNVVETLVIAIILVILVVYFFLQDFKSTVIPSISIIVSLIGTFACLVAADFSLNILTLFALVLAIGIVVDDAIIVVEAVQTKFEIGYKSPYLAAKDGMADVSMAIITCSIVFMAVFIPVCFMGGTSGVFYTQFGITMATAVGISLISAMTLCPALCAVMMRPSDGEKSLKSFNGRVRAAYEASFNVILGKYKRGLMYVFHHRWLVWGSLGVAVVLLIFLMNTTKTGLVPQEDQGTIMVNIGTSPGNTLVETQKVVAQVNHILEETPEIDHYSSVAGYGLLSGQGTSYATVIIKLKHWDERKGDEHTADAVMTRLNARFAQIKEASIFCFQAAMIPGYGMGNSIELNMQDKTGGDMTTFYQSVMQFVGALNERPEVAMAYTTYAMDYPQIAVELDAAKCKRAGLAATDVLDALGTYCGGSYVSNYNQFGKVYRVMVQASPEFRLDEHSLDNMFVRNGTEMAPLSQFVTLKAILGPEIATRFNLYSSITVNVNAAEGYSSGQVQQASRRYPNSCCPRATVMNTAAWLVRRHGAAARRRSLSMPSASCSSTSSWFASTRASSFRWPSSCPCPSDCWARSSLPAASGWRITSTSRRV